MKYEFKKERKKYISAQFLGNKGDCTEVYWNVNLVQMYFPQFYLKYFHYNVGLWIYLL